MASKTTVTLIDDLDGSEAAETVSFGLDGRLYEADLSEKNAAKLRKSLEKFVAAARKSGGRVSVPRPGAHSDPSELSAIREWAAANGHQVAVRGRIAKAVRDAYANR